MPSSVATFVPSKRYVRQQSIFSADLGVPLWKPAKATLCTPGSPKVSPNAYGWKTKITCSFHIVPKAQSLPRTACIPCFSSPACGIAYMPGVYFMACIPCLISPACLPACLPACRVVYLLSGVYFMKGIPCFSSQAEMVHTACVQIMCTYKLQQQQQQ